MPEVEKHASKPNGLLPNSRFPLLVHRNGVASGGVDAVWERFRANGWYNNWRYPGVYTYPHFHSTTHECLGVGTGWMEVELFGRGGKHVRVEAGDVIVMPAGVSHVMVGHSDDIMMVGGYPEGRDWDNMQVEHLTEELRRAAAKRIMMCPIPAKDPVTGGPMHEWIEALSSVDADLNDFRDNLDAH